MVEAGREQLDRIIEQISGTRVVSFHTDLSTQTGERIMLFMLETNLEEKLG
ncbi:Na-translocating system protein MpsC family protein [Paenibacillus tarimensis]